MGKKIELVISISLDDIQKILGDFQRIFGTINVDGNAVAQVAASKTNSTEPKKRRRLTHPSGKTAADFVDTWLATNKVGRRRDLVNYLIQHGYRKSTANNMADIRCRELEAQGVLTRSEGYLNMK